MRLPGIILFPFTIIYSLVIRLRNHLFNIGYSRSFSFEIPVILSGNLTAGGAGKTPMVEYLVRLLIKKYKLTILSRGYKRTTHGFHLARGQESYRTLGDEPLQYFLKWGSEISMAVCEDRVEAIPKILFEKPETQVVLMDDGYQHRAVSPDLKILLTDYFKPFFNDYLLPSGRLREPRKEARRADLIVVTKCKSSISSGEMNAFRDQAHKYSLLDTPVFFSSIKYEEPKPLFNWVPAMDFKNVMIISGIANPIHFENYVASKWDILNVKHYPDHYIYKPSDLKLLRELWNEYSNSGDPPAIVTTEKDSTKLTDPEIKPLLEGLPVYAIPIEMIFVEGGPDFDARIVQAVKVKAGF